MNEKGKLISEKDIEELSLKKYKENIKLLQEKEQFINQLPYNEEYPRFFNNKFNTCHTIILRSFWFSTVCGAILSVPLAIVKNNYSNSNLHYYKAFPLAWTIVFMYRLIFSDAFHPLCQAYNRGDMGSSTVEEETFKFLIEKCDIYDHIDSLLELKDKYTIYELEQLQKEWNLKNMKISVENFERFRERRNKNI